VHAKFLSENLKGRDNSEDPGVDRKIILELNLEKYGDKFWIGFNWHRIGFSGGLLQHGDELSGFIKGEEFLGKLSDC
jgi:hypothetical protein